jgi:hypothetical protein
MNKVCGAKTRTGGRCKVAGMANGRCRKHGGKAGRPAVHGRYARVLQARLRQKLDGYRSDPTPGDLAVELALTRALLDEWLERHSESLNAEEIGVAQALLRDIRGTVDTMNRIYERTSLTAAEVQYLKARIADLAVNYIPNDEQRAAFFLELEVAVGGGPQPLGPGNGR